LQGLLRATTVIDRLSQFFAVIASVLVLLAALISAGNAISRYAFDLSSNAWLEVQWQMFAGIFLLGAPYVLKLNGHVRVDMLYSMYSPRGKLWVDVFGIVFFLLPAFTLMVYLSWPWFLTSYAQGEHSANAGGLLFWPVKGLLPLGFSLMLLQGLAELVKRIAGLVGAAEVEMTYEKMAQ